MSELLLIHIIPSERRYLYQQINTIKIKKQFEFHNYLQIRIHGEGLVHVPGAVQDFVKLFKFYCDYLSYIEGKNEFK